MKEKFVITFLSQLSTYSIHLIATLLLFSRIDVTLLGIWTFSNSIINLGFLFMNIGFATIHLQYSGKKNSSEYFGTFLMINMVLIGINIAMSLILISILQLWGTNYSSIIIILLFSRIIFQIANILYIQLKSKFKIFQAEIPYFLISLGKSITILYLVFNLTSYSDPLIFIGFTHLIFDITFIFLLFFFSKNELHFIKPKRNLFLNYLRDVKPIVYFSIIYAIATNLGVLIIKYTLGLEQLGYYSFINYYVITPLLMISGIFIQMSIVLYSKHFKQKDFLKIRQTTQILEKYFSIIFLIILIFVYINSTLIFSQYLPNYSNSVQILYIMILIPYLVGITRPYSIPLISGNKLKIKYNISSFTSVFTIFLMLFLIPEEILFFRTLGLGTIGCALAQTLPWIIWMILNHFFSNKFFELKFQKEIILHLFLAIFSIIISFVIKNFLLNLIFNTVIFQLISSTLVSVGMFILLLFITKQLKRKDIKFFIQLFNIKSYKLSFQEEFSR